MPDEDIAVDRPVYTVLCRNDVNGADALRWYIYSAQAPWTSARFDEPAIRTAQREFLIRLYNVYSFFAIYANIDGFEPLPEGSEVKYSELDRWILSELNRTVKRRIRAEGAFGDS